MSGSDNRLKTPLANSVSQVGAQRAADAAQALAKGIPAQVVSRSGQMVTCAFQVQVGGIGGPFTIAQATYPIATSVDDWLPLDAGTPGLLLPSDFYLGGISGQGGGTADFSQRGNLATLVFLPVSNVAWTTAPGGDGEKRCLQGPNGVYMRDTGGTVTLELDKATGISATFQGSPYITINGSGLTLSFGGHTISITSAGISLDGIIWQTHTHDDPQGGTVGPPHNP